MKFRSYEVNVKNFKLITFLSLSFLVLLNVGWRRSMDVITGATPEIEKEAMFYQVLKDKDVQCLLCFRKCVIRNGKTGFCRVRKNIEGKLYSLVYSKPSAVQIDPVEKEPQYHFLPGTNIFCIGTVGCNFKCLHCHNWHLSQASPGDVTAYYLPPEKIVELAIKNKCPTISFTYNDPIVFYEYVYDIAKLAKEKKLKIMIHTNGSINQQPLKELLKYVDTVTVDLKAIWTEILYKMSQGKAEPVLETIKTIKKEGKWLELVNLIVTGRNDKEEHIRELCKWIKENVGTDVPLHFTRFFPNYKYTGVIPTPIATLEKAYRIAKETGINYVYIGNVPGHQYNSTYCPNCGKRLIYRIHFEVLENNIVDGKCKFCNYKIPGVWK